MSRLLFCSPCRRTFSVQVDPDGRAPCPRCGTYVAEARCDVFVSFASEDLERAQEVVSFFRNAAIECWLAPERIDSGESFTDRLALALAEAKALVLVLSSHAVESKWVKIEVTEAVGAGLTVLPYLVEEFSVPRTFRMLLNQYQWATSLDKVLDQARAALRRNAAATLQRTHTPIPARSAAREGVDPNLSPYIGPQPFPSRTANRFFGRQSEAEDLLKIVNRSRLVLIYAPSGAGKSSLLNTVVTQGLEESGSEVLLNARVGGALPMTYKANEISNLFTYSALYSLLSPVEPNPQLRLKDGLRQLDRRTDTHARVLVIDQFEELFTQHQERHEQRAAFITEIVEALDADASLRVVLAMRQEYLADIEPHLESIPQRLDIQRMRLNRLGPEAALETITRPAAPYAAFAPNVAEEIVSQLNTIRVQGFDRVPIVKRGEFIEMVHLQIVCTHLWSHLPAGITVIEREHLDAAAGEGQTFNEFVVNALNVFYDSTISKVADSALTRNRGGYSKDLIRLGMMRFVTASATRTMVPHAHGRVGRLPDWIVEQLENEHLIRFDQRGGQRWYELSHDRLAGPVGRQMDRDVSALLFAADLLATVHENVLADNNNSLDGYFGDHRDVLLECDSFKDQVGLFADEAEFVFRASLRRDYHVREWSARVRQDFPLVHVAVLRDALMKGSADVRSNAAKQLGRGPVDELMPVLVQAAIADPDERVRKTAATSVAKLDRQASLDLLIDGLAGANRERAVDALVRIRVVSEVSIQAPTFEHALTGMDSALRRSIYWRARWVRLLENLPVLAFVFIPSATLAGVSAALFKWLPSMFNWSVTQARASFVIGMFQGVVASVFWAGMITVGISLYYIVFDTAHQRRSLLRPFGAIVAGAISGVVSSVIIVFLVLGVFGPETLEQMGWVGSKDVTRFGWEFFADIFWRTRFGWVDIVTGTGLGIGVALATNAHRASERWQRFLNTDREMAGFRDVRGAIRDITRIARGKAWPLPVASLVAAAVAFFVPDFAASATIAVAPDGKATSTALAQGLVADTLTQVIGAFWGIVGMGVGLVLMRTGFRIDSRKNQE